MFRETSGQTLGDFLSDVLRVRGMSPAELQTRLGISSKLLDQLLAYGSRPGLRPPKPPILRSIAILIDVDERDLLRLAGYDVALMGRPTGDDADVPAADGKTSLGDYLRHTLQTRKMSGSLLAQLAGVSQGTISNLLRSGTADSADGPRPQVLRAVCEVLDLDQVKVFQLAGYIAPQVEEDAATKQLSKRGEYVGRLFDSLTHEQQDSVLTAIQHLTHKAPSLSRS